VEKDIDRQRHSTINPGIRAGPLFERFPRSAELQKRISERWRTSCRLQKRRTVDLAGEEEHDPESLRRQGIAAGEPEDKFPAEA